MHLVDVGLVEHPPILIRHRFLAMGELGRKIVRSKERLGDSSYLQIGAIRHSPMIKISLGDRFQNSCKVMILGNQILGLLGEPGHLYASQPIPCQPAEYSLKNLTQLPWYLNVA